MEIPILTSTRKKKVIKKGTFSIDMYIARIEVHVMATAKDVSVKVRQLCKKYKVCHKDVVKEAYGYTVTFSSAPRTYYLILSQDGLTVNTISHEIDHLRNYVLEYQGIETGGYNNETSANLNGYLTERIFRFLTQNNIPIIY